MINLPANILIKSKKPAPGAVTRARIFFKLNTADPELSGRRNIFISSWVLQFPIQNRQFVDEFPCWQKPSPFYPEALWKV